jgi:outer membrane protein TolC
VSSGAGLVLPRRCGWSLALALWLMLGAIDGHGAEASQAQPVVLTLSQAIERALQVNRDIQGSQLSVESRQESLTAAEASFEPKIYPSASGGVIGLDSQDEQWRVGAGVTLQQRVTSGIQGSISPRVDWIDREALSSVAFSLDFPLLRGLGRDVNLDSVYSSMHGIRSARHALFLTRTQTVVSTVAAVYDILRQEQLATLYSSQVQRLQGYAQTARIRERAGMDSAIDVYRAEIRIKDAESALTLAQEGVNAAQDRLKVLLAVALEQPIAVAAPIEFEPVTITAEQAVGIALERRVELIQAREDIAEAERKSAVARHNVLPELDLVVNYSRAELTDELATAFGNDEQVYSVNLVSRTDLTRSVEKSALRQSVIEARRTRLTLEQRQEEVKREVRQQLDALSQLERRMALSQEQIHQAQGKVALAEIKYRRGLGDNFDLIESETELQSARTGQLGLVSEYIVGVWRLRSVLGTLLDGREAGAETEAMQGAG